MPVLDHDGFLVQDSVAISEYLEDAFAKRPFRPAGAAARARMREWTQYIAAEPTWAIKVPSFNANIRPQLAGSLSAGQLAAIAARMPNKATAARWEQAATTGFTEAEIRASLDRLAATLDRMEAALAAGPWLAGADYSLADMDMAPFVHRLAGIGESGMIAARPRAADWYARMLARSAFATAMGFRPAA